MVDQEHYDTTTDQCTGGEIGSIVLYPDDGPQDGPLVFKVVSSLGSTPVEECVAPFYGQDCIVARRSMHFVPHHPFEVPISMEIACAGLLCPDNQTCVGGTCVASDLDPDDCDKPEGCEPTPDTVPPWQQKFGGTGQQMARHLARGADGTVVVTGNFTPTVDLGGGPIAANPGGNDIFAAAYSPA